MRAPLALLLITACGPASALPWRFEPAADARSFVAARLAPEAVVTSEGVHSVRPEAPWLRFEGVAAAAALHGEGSVPGRTSDFSGRDVASWRHDVCRHESVRVQDAWPGIDVVHHARGGELEHDFVVAPGADPSMIRLRLERATEVEPMADGSVLARAGGEALTVHAPVAWQGGAAVEAAWRLEGRTLTLRLGPHDPTRELVVDPILRWSTWLGDSGNSLIHDQGLVVLPDGDIVVLSDADQYGGADTTWADGGFALVARLASDLTDLRWAAYLPSASGSHKLLDLLPDGRLLVASTEPAGLPVLGGADCAGPRDPYLRILTPDGLALERTGYVGTLETEGLADVAVSETGDILLAETLGTSLDDWQVTRIGGDLTTLRWRRVLGTSLNAETPHSVALHAPTDDVLVLGDATGLDFPTVNAWIPSPPPPGWSESDCLPRRSALARLHGGTGAPIFATYVAFGCNVAPSTVLSDAAGDIVVVATVRRTFPPVNAPQPENAGAHDVLTVRLDALGQPIVVTHAGGSAGEYVHAACLDPGGRLIVGGHTFSADHPRLGAWGLPPAPPVDEMGQLFVTRFNLAGAIDFASTWGGVAEMRDATAIAAHPSSVWSDGSDIVLAGYASVADYPTTSGALTPDPPVVPRLGVALSGFITVVAETISSMGEPATASYPLRLGAQGPELVLGWDETLGDRDARFGLYMGTIASLRTSARWDHRPLSPCSFAAPPATVPMPDGDVYFLLTSVKGEEESSYGRDSFGRERPAGRVRCR